jgi:hypothetical protein
MQSAPEGPFCPAIEGFSSERVRTRSLGRLLVLGVVDADDRPPFTGGLRGLALLATGKDDDRFHNASTQGDSVSAAGDIPGRPGPHEDCIPRHVRQGQPMLLFCQGPPGDLDQAAVEVAGERALDAGTVRLPS